MNQARKDVLREDNGDFQMKVIGSVFSGAGKDGDFDWMITQDHYEDALFVFNDNEGQYKAHRDQPTDLAGAGWSVRAATCEQTRQKSPGNHLLPGYDAILHAKPQRQL
jgi:hypothetical protein